MTGPRATHNVITDDIQDTVPLDPNDYPAIKYWKKHEHRKEQNRHEEFKVGGEPSMSMKDCAMQVASAMLSMMGMGIWPWVVVMQPPFVHALCFLPLRSAQADTTHRLTH